MVFLAMVNFSPYRHWTFCKCVYQQCLCLLFFVLAFIPKLDILQILCVSQHCLFIYFCFVFVANYHDRNMYMYNFSVKKKNAIKN